MQRKFRLYFKQTMSQSILKFLGSHADDDTTIQDINHQKPALRLLELQSVELRSPQAEFWVAKTPIQAFLCLYPSFLEERAQQFLQPNNEKNFFKVDLLQMSNYNDFEKQTDHWNCLQNELSLEHAFSIFKASHDEKDIFGTNIKQLRTSGKEKTASPARKRAKITYPIQNEKNIDLLANLKMIDSGLKSCTETATGELKQKLEEIRVKANECIQEFSRFQEHVEL